MSYVQQRGRLPNTRKRPSSLRAVVLGLAGAWLAVVLWGGVDGDLGIMTIHASIHPAISGRTVLGFPPLGSIAARTHTGPLRIDFRVDQVHIEETAQWLQQHKSPQETADLVENGVKQMTRGLAGMAVLAAAIGALCACALFKVGWKNTLKATTAGVLGVAVPLALAAFTYAPSAFDSPEYEGELARAPHLLNLAQQAWQTNAGLVRDIPRIAGRTAALCQRLEYAGYESLSNPRNYYCVLAISDLHNNPAAVKFALQLAQTYQAKLVIIAGDFTDLGHPLEAQLLAGLKSFHIPIVAVAGNHDSRATVRALKTVPEMTILDGQVVTRGGVSILGFGDPAARRASVGSVNTSRRQLRALERRIGRCLARGRTPDVLLVHNNVVGRDMAGRVPVVVDGHIHAAYTVARRGSVIVNPGTTGAAGLRYFSSANKPACTAAVLHFAVRRRPRLRLVDSIRVELPSGDFTVSRRTVSTGATSR